MLWHQHIPPLLELSASDATTEIGRLTRYVTGEAIEVLGGVVCNFRMALKKPPDCAVQDMLVEEPQVPSDLIEVEITKAGSRFKMLLEATHPPEAGESVNERALWPRDLEGDPLAVKRRDAEVELPSLHERRRMCEGDPRCSVKPDDATRARRQVGKQVKDTLRGSKQIKRRMMGKDGVGSQGGCDQIGIRLKAARARAGRYDGVHPARDSTKATGAEVIARARNGSAERLWAT